MNATSRLNNATSRIHDAATVSPVQENTILSTRDYGRFVINIANRPIQPKKLEKMRAWITRKNLLHLFPIIVSRDFTVVDGQHRLKVAEMLGVPVYYIVSDQMRIEDAATINTVTDRWTIQDWLGHWCALGLPEYLKLKAFSQKYPWFPLSLAREFCAGSLKSQDVMDSFMSGTYRVAGMNVAEQVAQMAVNFSRWADFWRSAYFLRALRQLALNPQYSHKRMLSKMDYQSSRLVKCATAEDYLKLLNEIYNYRTSDANRVVFESFQGVKRNAEKERQRKALAGLSD